MLLAQNSHLCRPAAAGLHGDAIVFVWVEQIEARHRGFAQVEKPVGFAAVDSLQSAALEIREHAPPERLAFADDDGAGVFERLVGHARDVQAAHNHGRAVRAVAVGDGVGVVDLCGERGNGDEIVVVGQIARVAQIGDLAVFDIEMIRCEAGEREQREARQGGDDFAAFDEAGQGETGGEQLRVLRADAAHGNEADAFLFHNSARKVSAPATSRLSTGTAKRWRAARKCAASAQQTGIVTPPMRKAPDATFSDAGATGSRRAVTQKTRFAKPSPKNEMCPSRYMRRIQEP